MFKEFIIFVIGVLTAFAVIVFGIQAIHLFSDNVPVVCLVDGKEVHRGRSYEVDLNSRGANTQVTIRGGFMYLFPVRYYVSHDVDVHNQSEKE